ncbi:hypothetical protein IQ251_03460 [Saccharopolyspora sp. HNM0983]|uniref:Actinobacteria/chloroflexi VLRF1 release factor domain-containing protein n=1 Tax=Saccharopolyspora montiporae TaxID=2781240 RepID=A0A929B779_9PSEU|nr:hypothetical protein [Saccharopolyspora sp. HNM0983]
MSRVRELSGGGRAVEVEPERLAGWFERFAAAHGGAECTTSTSVRVRVLAADGASAEVDVPFGPLPHPRGRVAGLDVDELVRHLSVPRRIGLVLVRRGAHSVGIARDGRVETSSTDRHLVQGRSKAGGWSQQRFARRRAGQSRKALDSAADAVARVLLPERARLDGVLLGGDRSALDALRVDPRLRELLDAAGDRVLDVPEPRKEVLLRAASRARCAEVRVHDAPAAM